MATLESIGYGVGKYLTEEDQNNLKSLDNVSNVSFLHYRLSSIKNLSYYNAVDGFIDSFEDETGVDTAASTNETFDGVNKLYSPTGGNTNMTLISNSYTANSESDFCRIVVFEEDVSAITLNTDLKGYISRDGGTTWTQATLEEKKVFSSSTYPRILVGSANISSQPSGTSMKFKIETLNNKDLKIHGVSLDW